MMTRGRSPDLSVRVRQIHASTSELLYRLPGYSMYSIAIVIVLVPFTLCIGDSQICLRREGTFSCSSPPPPPPDCPFYRSKGDINKHLIKIAKVIVTADNVIEYSQNVVDITSNGADVTQDGLQAVAISLQKIVDFMIPSQEVTENIIQIVDNILDAPDDEFVMAADVEAPAKILDLLEQQLTLFQTQGKGNNLTVIGNNIAIVALQIPESSLNAGLGFGALSSPDGEENKTHFNDLGGIIVFSDSDDLQSATLDASILLPPYLVANLPADVKGNGSVPVTFFIFQNSKLFQGSDRLVVGTRVISATVEGVVVDSLPRGSEVEMTFLELNATLGNEEVDSRTCVFWEKTDQGGRWSPEGCRREENPGINRIRCLCDHLTSFAVLLDFYGDEGPYVYDVLSMIGCVISIICLLITIVTYLSMKKLRSKQPRQIMIHLCFALLGLYLVFVIGIDRRYPTTGCVIVGFLIHFFLLSSMSWMLVEAVNMYLLFVIVMNTRISRFLLKASICAYGFPLLVCIITASVDSSFYLGDDTYCFVKPGPARHYGVLLIVALLLTVNFILFGMVMQRLSCRKSQVDRSDTWRRVQNAVAISILLGLTWLFGFLAIGGARFLFRVLFLIFNCSQGFFIFLMFCVRQKEVRERWVQWMHCPSHQRRREENVEAKDKKTRSSQDMGSSFPTSSKDSMQMTMGT